MLFGWEELLCIALCAYTRMLDYLYLLNLKFKSLFDYPDLRGVPYHILYYILHILRPQKA